MNEENKPWPIREDRIKRLETSNKRLRALIDIMEELIRDTVRTGQLDRVRADNLLAYVLAELGRIHEEKK
jgi:hypothetical protein